MAASADHARAWFCCRRWPDVTGACYDKGMALSDEQLERYARHIVLKEIGGPGQQKLLKARVLIVGAGGLGSPRLIHLGYRD